MCILAVAVLGLAGVILRVAGLGYIGNDMTMCLIPWYDSVDPVNGIKALQNYTGNYGMPYVTILMLLHFLPGEAPVKIKIVSVIFEYAAAVGIGLLAAHFFEDIKKYVAFAAGFGLTILYPALIIDGAWWGQCDGIYVSFVVFMILALLKDKPLAASILLGCAFAFKFQTVFILPFLILFYFRRRKVSALWLLVAPVVVEIFYIPAFFAGYSPLAPITIYLYQADQYPQMYMNYPGLWCFFWQLADYEVFHLPVMFWIAMGFALFFLFLMDKGSDLSDRTWLEIAFWSSLFPVYFLPAMHERYSTIAELIAIVFAILYPKRAWISAFFLATISWALYQPVLLDRQPEQKPMAMGMMVMLMALTVFSIRDVMRDKGAGNSEEMAATVKSPAGKSAAHVTKVEKLVFGFFDRYTSVVVVAVSFAFFIVSLTLVSGYVFPDWLTSIPEEDAIPSTLLWQVISGKLSNVRNFTALTFILAAYFWTFILAFKPGLSQTKLMNRLGFILVGFMFLPVTFFYPVICKRPDGICLILAGIAYLFYSKSAEKKDIVLKICAVFFFGLSIAMAPAYFIFDLCVMLLFHLGHGDLKKSVVQVLLVLTVSGGLALICGLYRNGAYDLFKQGALIFPITILFYILCTRNIRYIASLMVLQFGALFHFGKYVWGVLEGHLILYPVLTVVAIILAGITFYLEKSFASGKRKVAGL